MHYHRRIEIYVPLMRPDIRKYSGSLDDLLKELCLLSEQLHVMHNGERLAPITIETISKTNPIVRQHIKTRKLRPSFKFLLKFTSSFGLLHRDLDSPYYAFPTQFMRTVQHLIICLNILKPGAYDSRTGVMIRTENSPGTSYTLVEEFPMLCSALDLALDLVEEYKWPPVKTLETDRVKSLLEDNWTAFEVTPNNRLQRALNAFSYLFHDNLYDNSHIDLFYSLIGIEALYVDGKDNVQKQVDTKSQLLLGERTVFKKKFNELYDFRSRYIHGQLNFTNKYNIKDFDNDAQTHRESKFSNASLGMMILLASIQKHLELGKSEIEFEYRIKQVV